MKYELQVIGTDASKEDVQLDRSPTLQELQDWVKGPIEVLHLNFHGRVMQMVVNEEGYIQRLPPNYLATTLYGQRICGPVVLFLKGQLE